MGPSYQYAARMIRVVDGDTYEMQVDLGFRIYHSIHVRLRNFDTAELRSSDPVEVAHAKAARHFVMGLLPSRTEVVLVTAKAAIYNRWEAHVWYKDGLTGMWMSLSDTLRMAGYEKRKTT